MKFLPLILFYFSFLVTISQTNCDCYQRLEYLAELKSFEGKNPIALELYKKALTFLPNSAKYYIHDFNLSLFYLKNGNIDSSAIYLTKAIKGGYPKTYLEFDIRIDSLQKTHFWNDISKSYRTINENFNWVLYEKINGLKAIDQSLRTSNGIGSIAIDSLSQINLYFKIDSIVFNQVIELINQYGYPNQFTHGFSENYLLYFLHSSMYSEEKFQLILKHMRKQYNLCQCHKGDIAMINDRRLDWYYKKKQIAGTWNFPEKFNPISDLTKVDSIRFEYNLLNLYDWGRLSGRPTPEGYFKKEYPNNYFCEKTLPNKK